MLTLMLLRHAKAIQKASAGDFARTLTDKGAADASALGACLARSDLIPTFAHVSSSARTMQTWEFVAAALGRDVPFSADESLYNATAGDLRDRLRVVAPGVATLMIVGHNPGIVEAAIALTRSGDPSETERMKGSFPPCGLAVLTFNGDDWTEARSSGGRLDLFLTPENFVAPC